MTNKRSEVKIECPKCNGTGKASTTKCKLCGGNGVGPFYHGIMRIQEAPSSRQNVTNNLRDFAFWLGFDNIEDLNVFCRINGKFKKEILLKKLQDYFVDELRGSRRLIYKTQEEILGCLKNTYERVEDIRGKIDWREFHKFYVRHPIGLRTIKKTPYLHSDIKKLFDHADPVRLQYKPLIALLASTGIRLGAIHEEEMLKWRVVPTDKKDIPYLKFKDLKSATEGFRQEQLDYLKRAIPNYQETFRVRVYSDEVDPKTGEEYEYDTYSSPEAHDLIVEMRQQRERDGEVVTEDSPVFRTEYNPNPTRWGSNYRGIIVSEEERERRRIYNLKNPTALPHHGIQSYIDDRRQRYLDYKVMHGVTRGKARKDGPQLMHGFRYFHETTMGIKGVDKHVMEWLQGRELKTLAERYEDWPPEEILREYWKAVGALTIDQTKYLQLTIDEKDQQIKDLKMDEQHRKEFEWGVQSISNQAIQNSIQNQQSIEQLAAVFMTILTPEQKEMMARQLPQMKDILLPQTIVSSLPLEDKKIIVVNKDGNREGSDDGGSNDGAS